MKEKAIHGVLVVGHGSRRQEANDDVRDVAGRISARGGFDFVEAAFLEIEHPTVAEGFERLVERGVLDVTVHPYFLSPGRHTRGDLPLAVDTLAARFPWIRYRITEPLAAHPLVVEASIQRIRETISDDESPSGIVYLVGAGPGAPDLLTLRARDLLASCDTIVYDYLIDLDLLNLASARAERIYVGKVGRGRQTSQAEINELLIQHAREGKRIVRLKGGDPFLFGRGSEEAEALHEAGIPFEIVPGVSSALAVPAYAGIPLTRRGVAASVAILTGAHAGDGALASDDLSDLSGADTIVVLMGVAHLAAICDRLIASGRHPETPVAVIRWGTYEAQQTIVGTLDSIAREHASSGMRSPAVIVIGEVVRLRERLTWFEQKLADKAPLAATFATA
jgi:uroporphyrin-III C-methyltransferase